MEGISFDTGWSTREPARVLAASERRRASWFEIQGATNESTRMSAASNEDSHSMQRAKPPREWQMRNTPQNRPRKP